MIMPFWCISMRQNKFHVIITVVGMEEFLEVFMVYDFLTPTRHGRYLRYINQKVCFLFVPLLICLVFQ